MMYRFGEFSLDARSRRLQRGNERVQMRAKCFDALEFLLRHANVTVTKSQLITALWHDRDVDEASLTQLVYELRRHLGDTDSEMIATLPSIGYRFTAPVQVAPADSPLERYVDPLDVYELYAKGMFLLEKPGKTRFMEALRLFQRAADEMPSYAPAYVGLAQAWIMMGCSIYVAPMFAFPNGRAAAQRALDLDEDLAEPYALLAMTALFYDRDWQATARFASRALAMNASLQPPHEALAWMHIATGDLDEAAKIVIKSIEMIPASLALQVTLALIYRYRGQIEKSIALLRSVLEMDPTYDLGRYYLANVLVTQGALAEGVAQLQQVASAEPTVQVRSALAYALAVSGDRARAQEILRSLKMQAATEYVSPYSLAIVYAGLRDFDTAMQELRNALDERTPWLIFLRVESRFDQMRTRSDFERLLVDIGLRKAAA